MEEHKHRERYKKKNKRGEEILSEEKREERDGEDNGEIMDIKKEEETKTE